MFCSKCGSQVPDGAVCSCQQPARPQYQPPTPPVQQYQPPVPPPAPQQYQPPAQQYQPPAPPAPQQYQPPVPPAPQPMQQYPAAPPKPPIAAPVVQPESNRKLWSFLAYCSFLGWIFGICSKEKNDPRIRFNVGQGLILGIISFGLLTFSVIIGVILASALEPAIHYQYMYGQPIGMTIGAPTWAVLVTLFLYLSAIAFNITFMILGCLNVVRDQDKPLPVIGSWAFYL